MHEHRVRRLVERTRLGELHECAGCERDPVLRYTVADEIEIAAVGLAQLERALVVVLWAGHLETQRLVERPASEADIGQVRDSIDGHGEREVPEGLAEPVRAVNARCEQRDRKPSETSSEAKAPFSS